MLCREYPGWPSASITFHIECPTCWSTQRCPSLRDTAFHLLDKPKSKISTVRGFQYCQPMAGHHSGPARNTGTEEGKSEDEDISRRQHERKSSCGSPIRRYGKVFHNVLYMFKYTIIMCYLTDILEMGTQMFPFLQTQIYRWKRTVVQIGVWVASGGRKA